MLLCCHLALKKTKSHYLYFTKFLKKKKKKLGVSKQRTLGYKPTNAFLKLTKTYAPNLHKL
jgi:hypothetical protein